MSETHPQLSDKKRAGSYRVLTGVSTSSAAFLGKAQKGPVDRPFAIRGFAEFEGIFGDVHPESGLHSAVRQYFLNGGNQAWIVRAKDDAAMREVIGSPDTGSGLFSFESVDVINAIVLPGIHETAALRCALDYAENRRAMLLIDPDPSIDSVAGMKQWIEANPDLQRPNAVLYYPRPHLVQTEPDDDRSVCPSGTIAGLWARTDAANGVWHAPAGVDTSLRGVRGLDNHLSDEEIDVLSRLGVNAIKHLAGYGFVSWGVRTLAKGPATPSEWQYLTVRRLALFIEESLVRGLQWTVFDANDRTLWSQIRLSTNAFMEDLFRRGAFAGAKPDDAYFVRCDESNNPPADIDQGIVNIEIGFAPLKPAEFVVMPLQQKTV